MVPTLWRLDQEGHILTEHTLDISPFVPEGDTVTGIVTAGMPYDEVAITTDRSMLFLEKNDLGEWILDDLESYEDHGVESPDIADAVMWFDIKGFLDGEEPQDLMLLLDRTASKIYALTDGYHEPPSVIGSVDISPWVGGDTPEGMTVDYDSGEVVVAVRNDGSYPYSRLLRFEIDWDHDPDPLITHLATEEIDVNVYGLGGFIEDADITTRITIEDRNESPVLTRVYEGMGNIETATQALVDSINDDGVYEAEILVQPPVWLMPSVTDDEHEDLDPYHYDPFTGGTDADDPTNGDYLDGLAATESRTDTAWIHAVGANTNALWTAILLHCAQMFEQHQAERFAILETPEFESSHDEGSAEYLADLQDYVDDIVEMADSVGDRNAVIFAGGADFMDSDGDTYDDPVTAACGGTMAGLEVQKSLINKPVRNVQELWPEFSQGHIQSLIQARVNCIRFKPGRGYIIAHSLTAAAPGSDYSRVNDLRAVYYGSKAAREAAQPYVGEENDKAGEGLRRLESAMSRPLEMMRDGGQIDDFDLTAVSTENDRLLGDVYVSLGIQPRRAMEMIYTTVYLK